MNNNICAVRTAYHCPHVYFIFAGNVIYIGETQRAPVKRWGAHLGSTGSFTKKLIQHVGNEGLDKYLKSMDFYSINCFEYLKDIQSEYCGYTIPTQALEHKLHEIVSLESFFGKNKIIISETNKTAPRNFFHWEIIDEIAHESLKRLKSVILGAPIFIDQKDSR